MKIRIMGPPDEAKRAAELLAEVFDVIEVSQPYPCRGNTRHVRMYAEIHIP